MQRVKRSIIIMIIYGIIYTDNNNNYYDGFWLNCIIRVRIDGSSVVGAIGREGLFDGPSGTQERG